MRNCTIKMIERSGQPTAMTCIDRAKSPATRLYSIGGMLFSIWPLFQSSEFLWSVIYLSAIRQQQLFLMAGKIIWIQKSMRFFLHVFLLLLLQGGRQSSCPSNEPVASCSARSFWLGCLHHRLSFQECSDSRLHVNIAQVELPQCLNCNLNFFCYCRYGIEKPCGGLMKRWLTIWKMKGSDFISPHLLLK